MVDLILLDGGSPIKKNIKSEIAVERVKIFVEHLRAIENSISMVKRMADNMEWEELSKRAHNNHKQILETLQYVKLHKKQIIANMSNKTLGEHLKLID